MECIDGWKYETEDRNSMKLNETAQLNEFVDEW
jgi:hypothetical protein